MAVHESLEMDLPNDHHVERGSSPALPSLPPPQAQHEIIRTRARPILHSRLSSSRKKHLFKTHGSLAQLEADAAVEADLAAAFNTSSDPAFFSSDETPDLENYSHDGGNKRKKKVYSGTWWSGRLRSGSNNSRKSSGSEKSRSVTFSTTERTKRRKTDREFRRNFDSGIFMADELESSGETSSGMELSSDGLLDELEAERSRTYDKLQSNAPGPKPESTWHSSLNTSLDTTTRPSKKLSLHQIVAQKPSPLDVRVNKIVQQCLEHGQVDVDLTNMGIEDLPKSVTALRTLVRSQDPINPPFAPLSGRIRIYLANNRLSSFPGHLLRVPNIELLSLRQNRLSTLPDGIMDLKHLHELNISSNELEYLPFNVLKLCDVKLKKMQSEPNPWKAMPDLDQQLKSYPRLVLNQPDRSISRESVALATTLGADGTVRHKTQPVHRASGSIRSPFLSEVILRQLDKLHTAGTDLSISPDTELCSDNVRNMLHQLYRYQHDGRRICTFCERNIIMPRYQWLEWWRIVDFDVARGEINHDARYQVVKVDEEKDGLDDSDNDDDDKDQEAEEKQEMITGQILPFLRVSCGCRTQQEGLEEEGRMFEELSESCKDDTNDIYRVWPSLATWKP